MNKFDLSKLEALATGLEQALFALDPESVDLAIMAVQDRAIHRGAWLDDDGSISDARWDVAENLVHRVKLQLMTPVTVIDGGNA